MPEDVKPQPRFAHATLICSECGTHIDPQEYFAGEPLPDDEICLECYWRGEQACAYCQAYWLNENKSIPIYCRKCGNKSVKAW
jgi:hypothetical protein